MSVVGDFLKALACICRTKPLSPTLWQYRDNKVTVKLADVFELQAPGGAVCLDGNGLGTPILIVLGDDDEYHCFSNRCTHMGRRLDPVPGRPQVLCCSVMHSTYDYEGIGVKGPGKKAVRKYEVERPHVLPDRGSYLAFRRCLWGARPYCRTPPLTPLPIFDIVRQIMPVGRNSSEYQRIGRGRSRVHRRLADG
ncbi:MAG: Rieske (2Fe-2S) protein [Pseudomonadota bacterium]